MRISIFRSLPILWALLLIPLLAHGQAKIRFDRLVYDFGRTGQVETVTGTFKVRNEGDAVLLIKPPQPSCGCTAVKVEPETLAPGEGGELSFVLELGRTRASLEKHITVPSNDPVTPEVLLVIKAEYTPLYEVEPMLLAPVLSKGGSATNFLVNLVRTDGEPLRPGKLETSKPWITARFETGTNSSGKGTVGIRVGVQPEGPARRFSELVHVYALDPTNRLVTLIYVQGQVLGELAATPEAMYWSLGDPSRVKWDPAESQTVRRVAVRSVDGKPFELRNAKSTLSGLKLEVLPKEGGTVWEIVTTLGAAPAESLAGNITFDSSRVAQPRVEIPFVIHVARSR